MRQLDPSLFPRDTPIIDAQASLTFMDETVGAVARLTTTDLPLLFLALYLGTLALLAAAIGGIGAQLYRSRWTTLALLAAMTFRHAITKSGTNSLEGYFHPRQLAFAFGALAVAAFLRGRPALVAVALAGAASLHPTTTLWFAVWMVVAVFVSEPRSRMPLAATAIAAAVAGGWALTSGPLAGRLTFMDPEWLEAVADKEYLFPLRWPAGAWLVNLAYVPIIVSIFLRRRAAGLTIRHETGLVAGCLSLVAVFLIAVVLNAARIALAIQLQPARIFWMLDFLATIYIIWAIAEAGAPSVRRPLVVAAMVAMLSLIRGAYVMRVEFPDRTLFQVRVAGDWGRVAGWAQSTARESGWLADPFHAARYGTSLRMAAARDVFVEGTKDAAIGMYERAVALRTRDRLRQSVDFASMPVAEIRVLAARYQLDYLVCERPLALPIAFEAGAIRVYRIR